jgi:hypothetical protein
MKLLLMGEGVAFALAVVLEAIYFVVSWQIQERSTQNLADSMVKRILEGQNRQREEDRAYYDKRVEENNKLYWISYEETARRLRKIEEQTGMVN